MKLTLGFSPCPNDTFIFDALVNKKIDTGGFEFDVVLDDVETLNRWTLENKLDITKLSFPAFFQSLNNYVLLNAGSALGKGVGPLLIAKENKQYATTDIQQATIAIPGINTTANLLLSFAYPGAKNKKPLLFSKIEDTVTEGETELGVIIHENRFTYQQKGLHKVIDLGQYWEEQMNIPIPLGGIAIKRNIDKKIAEQVNNLIRKSLEFSFSKYPHISEFVKQHSQEMSEDVMRKHIDLYVNNYSIDLGSIGKQAIRELNKVYSSISNKSVDTTSDLFL